MHAFLFNSQKLPSRECKFFWHQVCAALMEIRQKSYLPMSKAVNKGILSTAIDERGVHLWVGLHDHGHRLGGGLNLGRMECSYCFYFVLNNIGLGNNKAIRNLKPYTYRCVSFLLLLRTKSLDHPETKQYNMTAQPIAQRIKILTLFTGLHSMEES